MSTRNTFRHYRLLAISLILFCAGLYQLLPFFTTRSELVRIQGKLQSTKINYIPVKRKGRDLGYNRAELVFTIENDNHLFKLQDEDNNAFMSPQFDRMLRLVDSAAIFTVHIDSDDVDDTYPTVYQIDIGNDTILDFYHVRTSHVGIAIACLVIAIGVYLIYYFS